MKNLVCLCIEVQSFDELLTGCLSCYTGIGNPWGLVGVLYLSGKIEGLHLSSYRTEKQTGTGKRWSMSGAQSHGLYWQDAIGSCIKTGSLKAVLIGSALSTDWPAIGSQQGQR